MEVWVIALLFFSIAVLYSSVGFGGGSSYIALMLLLGMAIKDVRFIALVCNIIVVSASTINYIRTDHFKFKKIFYLIILSVPGAFIGGTIQLDKPIFKIVSGVALILASLFIILKKKKMINDQEGDSFLSIWVITCLGGGIGFISGIIGIGGGIFLAPLLYLINWDKVKVIGAATAFFILVNSIAGLLGQATIHVIVDWNLVGILGVSVFLGGQVGNRLNIFVLKPDTIRILTALLICYVGVRLLLLNV